MATTVELWRSQLAYHACLSTACNSAIYLLSENQAHLGALTDALRDGNRSGYYPDRTGPDRTGYGFGPLTQIPGPGIYYPPSTRTGPDRMYLYMVNFS